MISFILITDNSESYVHDVLCSLLPLENNEELIVFDNHSKDETIPNIIATIDPMMWVDEKERYKLYINNKKEPIEEVKRKALSIKKGNAIFIEQKERFDISEVLKDVKNK